MAYVTLKGVSKSFGDTKVIKNLDLSLKKREFVVVVGPSGCGKTTLLRMIAGLEEITDGDILFDDCSMAYSTPADRNVSMMFQNFPLFPQKTVYENIIFSLQAERVDEYDVFDRVAKAVDMLGLEKLLDRNPGRLSGGERQRVALARAIVRKPSIFLFDEPLSNLDPLTRDSMREVIKKMRHGTDAPFLYVTHDLAEAMSLADRVLVLHEAVIQQDASPQLLYAMPRNRFIASFVGGHGMNFIPACVTEKDGACLLSLPNGKTTLLKSPNISDRNLHSGGEREVMVGIQASDLVAAYPGPGVVPQPYIEIEAIAEKEIQTNAGILLQAMIGEVPVTTAMHIAPPTPGSTVRLYAQESRLHLFDKETGLNLAWKGEDSV